MQHAHQTAASNGSSEQTGPARLGRKSADLSTLGDLFQLLEGVSGLEVIQHADIPVPMRHLRTGECLFHQGAVPEFVHFVRSGTFKTFRTALDGYEQVLGFVGRKEILGFDALAMSTHPSAAVSIEESTVYALSLRDLMGVGAVAPRLKRVVYVAVSIALNRQAELADVMSAAASEVRLARFLLTISRRMAALGESSRRLRLRMSRRDIASQLGVAHETISRCFQALGDMGLVAVKYREVEILDLAALLQFSQGTRRHGASAGRAALPGPAVQPHPGSSWDGEWCSVHEAGQRNPAPTPGCGGQVSFD